jgi:PAS domain S-box-containing protein
MGQYDYRLIVLSIAVSILAAFAVRALAERIKARGGSRVWWLLGGAVACGLGTWSMHYTSMLGFDLPVPILYHWPTVLLSLLVGIGGSGVALFVMSRRSLGLIKTIAASAVMGAIGISSLHYTAMASMRFQGRCEYSPFLTTVAILTASAFSFAALSLTFRFRAGANRHWGAIFLGLANPTMHYMAMAGASFLFTDAILNPSHDVTIFSLGIVSISVVPLMVLVVALLTSTIDRLHKQRALLDSLFEQAPEAVVLLDADQKVVRINQGFTRLFGYTPKEAVGRPVSELIDPDQSSPEHERALGANGLSVDAEAVTRRKDGRLLHISILQVPVRLPGEGIAVYAIYRDVTERKRVEQRLREYEKAVEGLDEMIVVVDRDYRYVVANRAFLKYRGLEGEQLVGRQISDMLTPGVFEDIVKAKLDECFAGQSVKYEMRYNYSQLGERDLSISYFPIEGPSGVDRVACILQDITEAKRAEEALRSSETKFRRLLDSSIVGVVFWDLQGNLFGANDLFLNMIGYRREDLEQGRISWKEITPPEYAPVDEQAIAELLATGNCTPFEKEYIRRDGSRVSVMIGSAMLEGQKDKGSSFIMDITERKQVEEELRQSEERFRQLAESITEVFWMTDPEKGEVLYVSPAYQKIWGRSCESVYQNPNGWLQAIHPEHRQRIEKAARTLQVSGDYDEEYQIIRPDGSVRWIRDRAFPVRDKAGRVYRLTGIAEDITERKHAEERLKTTTEQLRALSANLQSAKEEEAMRIARELHDELGGELTSLKWDLEIFEKTISKVSDQSQLRKLREKIHSMLGLVENTIGAVRRISSEMRPSVLDDLGLVEAIEWQGREFEIRTGVPVRYQASVSQIDLSTAQSTAIFRIVQEALTNVLRHAQATKVDIKLTEEAGELILTLSDNGRGITEDDKSRPQSLGLLGMQERAHLIGGEIEVTGVPGQGTALVLRVPISKGRHEQNPHHR